jgi:hypothetical protein
VTRNFDYEELFSSTENAESWCLAQGLGPRETEVVMAMQRVKDIFTPVPWLDHLLTVRVVVIVRAAVPDQASDPIVQSLHSKIMADLTLGGLAIDVQPGPTEFTLEQADTPVGVIYCTYRILYRTSVSDLSV